MYHSVALLLPDATVATAGSNPQRGTYDNHIEIYSPAYLFNADGSLATRPVITSAPLRIGYNSVAFTVQTPDALNIGSVVLVKPGSDTHAFDMEQRLLGLTFTAASGALTVNAPPNSNLAPPGYYLLFVLNRAGVPSVARFVQVSPNPTDQPPRGTITAPTGNVTITAGQSVKFAGTASDADGSVQKYSWFFPEGTPDDSSVPSPGTIVFPTAGTYVASLTAVDDKGVNDPSPPTRTVTVQPTPTATPTPTPISFVQSPAIASLGSSTTPNVTFGSNTTTGDTIIVIVSWFSAGSETITNVRDNVNGAINYSVAVPLYSAQSRKIAIYYLNNITGGTTPTITATLSTARPVQMAIYEFSGLGALDVTHTNNNGYGAETTGSITTTNANDLLIGAVLGGTQAGGENSVVFQNREYR
jgi:hypothetical protein